MRAKSCVVGILNPLNNNELSHYIIGTQKHIAVENADQPNLKQGLIGKLLESAEPVVINNWREREDANSNQIKPSIHQCFLGVPLKIEKTLGFLYFGDKLDNSVFNPSDIELANTLASELAEVFLANLLLYIRVDKLTDVC